ncbi:MAG TPA: lytic murein transglycosylase [Devosia sp.]|nr:lytic murein transglycosylase [Devosia sp.]
MLAARAVLAIGASLWLALLVLPARADTFAEFLTGFERVAVAAGVSANVYEAATRGLTPDPAIPKLVETQPEFTTPIWTYLDQRVNDRRIADGKAAMAKNKALFAAIGRRFGVDPYLLGAIWGIETSYGAVLGNPHFIKPVIRSLATLVWEKRGRYELDKADFIAALKLVQRGPLDAAHLMGSWAGAIGHLQVNPVNILAHGTDGDGDGRIDLQDSLADALATSAKFLLDLGYKPGLDWGYEVSVPRRFDYLLADRATMRPVSFFTALGVKRVHGKSFADNSVPVFLFAPAGASGPNFLMTANYLVLKGYNFSDSYALSVAHLSDRLKGADGFAGKWPRDTRLPDLEQRVAIEAALTRLGFYSGPADGRLGPLAAAAYAKFQASKGEIADGFFTEKSFDELSAASR